MSNTSRIVFLLMAAILCGAAAARPQFRSAWPAAGASTSSPPQITITFSEGVSSQSSGIELKDQAGTVIPTGRSVTDPANKKVMVVPVPGTLAPGTYTVEWHAVSDDTHRVTGSYSFSVTR